MESLTIQELIDWKPPSVEWIIDKVLPAQSKAEIFGPPKSWKSMLAIHTAFAVATGTPWLGYKTTQVPTDLIQFEISKTRFRSRIIKYSKGFGSRPPNIHTTTEHYVKFDVTYGYGQLVKVVERNRPGLIIIDPLYRVFSGGISDPSDMSRFLDNMDLLIAKYNCSVIIIHHRRKPVVTSEGVVDRGAEESMGSSYLGNWVDAATSTKLVYQSDPYDEVKIRFDLVRHAEEILKPMKVRWWRKNIQPEVMETLPEPTIRLEEEEQNEENEQ